MLEKTILRKYKDKRTGEWLVGVDLKIVIDDISNLVDSKKGIDSTTADKIVKMGYIQTLIIKSVDSSNGKLNETELENQLKTIMVKSWNDTTISDKVVNKVRKDIK